MDKQQARDIVRDTLGKPFDKVAYTRLARELFNQFDETKAFHARGYVPESYKKHVKTYERIATYTDPDDLKIDILIVYLQSETTLERARTSQRNFIAHYLKDRDQKDAGLVAFVSPDPSDWRFSLVKMDYKIDEKGKVKEDFTPARRWSFLVGTNENSHTAQSRLAPLIANDTHNPTLADLEEAFNIETVTKEFFTEYRNLFLRVKESLDAIVAKDATIKNNFAQKGVNTVDFAKKLLGQIVFLYFLQKKGWFGVARDNAWGTGSKQFLRELFDKKHGGYQNFFNDVLEPLFYDALSRDRSDIDHWNDHFKCKIPFLNGGLFDPINGYDWAKTDILISNELFSNNSKTSKGDIGDGILDVFDRYNFTVKEDEPLEKEVAIDPELLGKAYEKFNAIRPDNFDGFQKALKSGKKGEESKFNKQFGVYYTPREIVHYMCQQSLINYLFSQFNGGMVTYEKPGVRQTDLLGNTGKKGQLDLTIEHKESPTMPKEDIETLIHYGERLSDNEEMALIKQQKINDGHQKTSDYKLQLPESIRNNAAEIDRKLADIKVCDPAIGSGAFPVGMMSEIVRARNTLSTFIKNTDRSIYHFKRECIENSLYGVDIDSGAVEIAKLRLWLSLVVDEDDINNIKPLPNLDYKIVCGNSLMGLPIDILPDGEISKAIEEKKKQYFNATNPSEKNKSRAMINDLFFKLLESIKKYDSRIADIKFDFHTHFSEVFHAKNGFDIVISNPPYIGQKGNKYLFQELKMQEVWIHFYERKQDIYYYFISKGIDLLSSNGNLTYIIPPYFLTAAGASTLRKKIRQDSSINKIVNLSETIMVFESANINNLILFLDKGNKNRKIEIVEPSGENISINNFIQQFQNYYSKYSTLTLTNNEWYIFNTEADKKIKIDDDMDLLGSIAQISPGIQTGCDKLTEAHINNYNLKNCTKGEGIFVISDQEKNDMKLTKHEKQFVKPFYKNSDIEKWYYNKTNNKWIIITNQINDIDDCPNIKKHLLKYKKILDDRYRNFALINADKEGKWWYLYGYRPNTNFDDEKLILPYRSEINTFAYCDKPFYGSIDIFYINMTNGLYNSKYVCALLCSTFCLKWLSTNCKKKGKIFELYQKPLSTIPIKKISKEKQKPFIEKVDKILSLTQSEDYLQNHAKQSKVKEYEKEIDQMVYALYGLTEDEIKIVEGEGS